MDLIESTVFHRDLSTNPQLSDREFHFPASDAILRKAEGGILIDSTKYTKTSPQGPVGDQDNTKLECIYKDSFMVDSCETLFEVSSTSMQCFDDLQPIPKELVGRVRNIHDDYRLCCFGYGVQDLETGLKCMFVVTNSSIYAMYTVIDTFIKTYAILISKRLDDIADTLCLGVDGTSQCIRWYIGREEVFKINNTRAPLDDRYAACVKRRNNNKEYI